MMDINDPILSYSGFVDDRISTELFRLEEIPSLHPASSRWREFWKPEKQSIIQGKTINGVYMPPKLYFYANYGTIYRNIKGAKAKLPARPRIRDIEWMVHYNYLEARGFSGFADDPDYSCNNYLNDPNFTNEMLEEFCLDERGVLDQKLYSNLFKEDGIRKEYESPRSYLRKVHKGNFEQPLFYNQSQNFMLFGSRGFGKSYLSANIIAHEWLTDGATEYSDFTRKNPNAVEVIVGAENAKYSSDTLNKTKLTIEKLPGEYKAGNIVYPSPLAKNYTGSWKPGYEITAKYKKKVGGKWEIKGSGSMIKNRTFKDNPFAVQGTRPGLMLLEEVGMFSNLEEVYGATVENQREGINKFGTTIFTGTGGDFEGGGTRDAYKMFYNPQNFDILPFEDVWEARPNIGFFLPAYMGLDQFKNSNGFTDILSAKNYLEEHRFKLQKQEGAAEQLRQELQYRPIKPSEMFLSKSGNIFPIAELKQRLESLENNPHHHMLEKKVKLIFDSKKKYGVAYQIDSNNELIAINEYPWGTDKSREGCPVIYEFPRSNKDGIIPKDLYVIGHDPIASDTTTGESLSVTIVLKTKEHWLEHGHDEIVAIYAARPYLGREVINDNLLKLSMLYGNAKIFYENNVGNTKEFFEKVGRLDLLAKSPQTIFSKRASFAGAPTNDYGYSMANKQKKLDGLLYIKDWLLEERGKNTDENLSQKEGRTIRNLDRIWDKALLQELISFNLEGNFDRVMAFMGCVFAVNEMFNQYKASLENASVDNDRNGLNLEFLTDSKRLSKLDISWDKF